MTTPIDRERVERLARDCQHLGDRADRNNLDGQYTRTLWKAQDTLLALRAALDEAEARAASAAQEARAAALREVADKMPADWGALRMSILALIEKPSAEALERVRAEAVMEGLEVAHKEVSALPEDAQKLWALEAITVAMMRQSDTIRARGEKQ